MLSPSSVNVLTVLGLNNKADQEQTSGSEVGLFLANVVYACSWVCGDP